MSRRRLAAILIALAVPLVLLAPTAVARVYAGGVAGVEVEFTKPHQGWTFIYHAARLSRGAELGTKASALEDARRIWAGPPAIAATVRLTYFAGPVAAPVPPGGTVPAPNRATITPDSRLGWVVSGSVRGGPAQPIGLLDYHDGDVAWDIRKLPAVAR